MLPWAGARRPRPKAPGQCRPFSLIKAGRHADGGVEQTSDRTLRLGREGGIHESRLRGIRDRGLHIEEDLRDGPARGQVFQGRGGAGFNPQRVKTDETEFVGESHRKTAAQRRGDQFVRVGAEAFGKAGAKGVLRVGQDTALGPHGARAFTQGSMPHD